MTVQIGSAFWVTICGGIATQLNVRTVGKMFSAPCSMPDIDHLASTVRDESPSGRNEELLFNIQRSEVRRRMFPGSVCVGFVMDFDRFTVVLLVLREDAPHLSEADAAELQDSHMSHLADLHQAGHLLAAGPLMDDHFRGLSILNVDPETARRLKEDDPAVRAGRFDVLVMPWMVPEGAMTFSATSFPRSMAEAE